MDENASTTDNELLDVVGQIVAEDQAGGSGGNNSSSSSSSRCPSRQNSLLARHGSGGKKAATKSVSFHSATSLPTERKIASANDCLQYMMAGSSLLKIRSSSRQYSRFFTLLEDMSGIRWTPTSKKSNKALREALILIDGALNEVFETYALDVFMSIDVGRAVAMSSIREIRSGKGTDVFRGTGRDHQLHGGTGYSPDCIFSIVYGDNFETLDLVASTPEESNIWVTGLNALIGAQKSPDATHEDQIHPRDKWLQEVFHRAADESLCLSDEEAVVVAVRLNTQLTASRVQRKIAELESQRSEGPNRGKIDCNEFIHLYKEIATRPEIYFLMIRNANKDFLTVEDLQLFLEGEQGVSGVTAESCRQIVDSHEPFDESRLNGQLHIDGFTEFLLSEECDLFDPSHRSVCQDMTQPLTHYFVSTSHNTYLLEDQLKGPSSADGYAWALNKGCRCIKVDCWDGVEEPVVYHGNTLTSRVSFREVVAAIKEHAFAASRYPLIVHLENHCSVVNQRFIARHLLAEWKDLLFVAPKNSALVGAPAVTRSACVMSPEEIGSRIILKGRKLSSDCHDAEGDVSDEDEGSSDSHGKRLKGTTTPATTLMTTPPTATMSDGGVRQRKLRLCRELSDLISLSRVRFKDFHSSTRVGLPGGEESHSLCESTAAKLAHACPEDFVQHNKHFMTRVFPNGSRIDSSNYNPQDFWNCGCQMVALNFQTPGQMLDLHDGRFRQNGGCGYVLKPSVMREPVSFFPGHNKGTSIPGLAPQILRLKVVSGQQLPRPRGSTAKGDSIDPYVVVQVFGIPADCAEVQTRTVSNEGNSPTFDESFEFQLNLPEVAMVRFVVLDDDYIGDDFIGQYTIAFDCLRTGYRHVRLLSMNGTSLGDSCTLFVHVAITNKRGGGGVIQLQIQKLLFKCSASMDPCLIQKSQKFRKRPHSDIKAIGVRAIDDIIKSVLPSVDEAELMRSATDWAMTELREEFGLCETANIKQCLRALVTRVANGPTDDVTLVVVETSGFPELQVRGPMTQHLNKTIVLFDKVLQEFRNVTDNSDGHLVALRQAYEALLDTYEDLEILCMQAGLKGKKLNKALDTCAWNMQILRGQIDLLHSCRKECKQAVTQMQSSTDSHLLMVHPSKHKDRSPVISRERPRLALQGQSAADCKMTTTMAQFPEFLVPTMPRSPTSPSPDHPRSILKNKSSGPSLPRSPPLCHQHSENT